MSAPPVILLAHGSRHPQAAAVIDELVTRVARDGGLVARAAYLDLCAPDLQTVATELAEQGWAKAVVVPLLFTEAFHTRVDLPQAVAVATAHSGLQLTTAPILGTDSDVVEVLTHQALACAATHPGGVGEYVLYAVGSSRPPANTAIKELGVAVARSLRAPVCTVFATGGITPLPAAVAGRVLLPVFTTHGLLLDQAEAQLPSAGPLGRALAPVVLARYRRGARSDRAAA